MRRATAAVDGSNLTYSFQSTLSVRRATSGHAGGYRSRRISIHALREESDRGKFVFTGITAISIHALREESDWLPCTQKQTITGYFNPRSPCGERLTTQATRPTTNTFQSTLSVRRATYILCLRAVNSIISIHALREESDLRRATCISSGSISIHALREESDQRVFRRP